MVKGNVLKINNRPELGFTQIPNFLLQKERISLRAKGLYCIIQSSGPNWQLNLQDLYQNRTSDGEGTVGAAMQELTDAGYLYRCRLRDDHGNMRQSAYVTFTEPTPREKAEELIKRDFNVRGVWWLNRKSKNKVENPIPMTTYTASDNIGARGGINNTNSNNTNSSLSSYSPSENKESKVSESVPDVTANSESLTVSRHIDDIAFRRRTKPSKANSSLKKDTTVSEKSSTKENITSSLKKLSKLEPETVPKPKRKLKTPVVNLKAELSRIYKKNPYQHEDEIFKVLSVWKEAGFKPLKREELNEIIRSLTLIFDGKYFENKIGANIIPSDVRTYSLQDILRAIRSCRLKAFDSAYYPFKKDFYAKMEFKTWLYNPYLNFKGENKIKSFFLEDLKNPASKIKPKFRVVESQYPKHVEILKRQFQSKFLSNNGNCACAAAAWSPEDDNNFVIATEKLMEFYEKNNKKFSDGKRKRYYKAKMGENEYIENPSMKISGFTNMLVEFFEFPGNYYPENDDGWPDSSDINVKKYYWKYQKKYESARDFFKKLGTDGLTDDVWFDYALPIFMKGY